MHEVPSRRSDHKRVVVCHFKSRQTKDYILSKEIKSNLRGYNNGLRVEERIYVNEHLSPENKKTFAMLSKRKRELGYKFLWTKNGICFVRKDESSNVIKILNCDEVAKMV